MKPRVWFLANHFQGKSDFPKIPPASGSFVGFLSLPWRECIVPDIPSGLSFIGCYFITSTVSWRSMRAASRRSTVSSGRSSRRSSSATWTAATRAAGLPASAVPTVGKIVFWCFPAALAVSAHRVIPRGLRSGASGCGRHSFGMSPTARSSSPSPRCCGYSSSTTASFWAHSAARPSAP